MELNLTVHQKLKQKLHQKQHQLSRIYRILVHYVTVLLILIVKIVAILI